MYETTYVKLKDLPVRDGNIIYVTDRPNIFLDFKGVRIPYSVQTYETEAERISVSSPVENTYAFCTSDNIFWGYFSGSWKQLTPSNLEPIVFVDDESQFPSIGKDHTLYSTKDTIYRYIDNTYVVISNATTWQSI